MMPDEKTRLLALLQAPDAWCQNAEACDREGNPVRYDDSQAVAWDLTGALGHLFGWQRASVLFRQLDRHIHGKPADHGFVSCPEFRAMAALQEFNDDNAMTHERILDAVNAIPVWRGAESTAV